MAPASVAARGRALVRTALTRWLARRGGTQHAPVATVGASPAPIIGRISMDQCCLDVTDVPEVAVGSPVTLPTRRVAVDGLIPRLAIEDPPA